MKKITVVFLVLICILCFSEKSYSQTCFKPINLSFEQITEFILPYFTQDLNATTIHGYKRYLGISEDRMVILEVIGSKENIVQASLLIKFSTPEQFEADMYLAPIFVFNSDPDFWDGIERFDFLMGMLEKLSETGETQSLISNNKKLELFFSTKTGLFCVTISSAECKDQPMKGIKDEKV